MNRAELLEHICPFDCADDCIIGAINCGDCKERLNTWLDEYDKHVIEQYEANRGLSDIIRDIHDCVAREMYCKGIDDFAKSIIDTVNDFPTVEDEYGELRPMRIEEMCSNISEQLKEKNK